MNIGSKVICTWIPDGDELAEQHLTIGMEYLVQDIQEAPMGIVIRQNVVLVGVPYCWSQEYFDLSN